MLCSLIKKLWKPIVYTGIGLRLLFSDPLYAQTANISGSINNQLGNRANNINIKLEQVENRNVFYNTVSDNNGNYSFSNVVVPVELMSFNAKYNTKDNKIEFEWATASETNNFGFKLEQLINNEWKEIGFIRGNGTTSRENNYFFNLNPEKAGDYVFRLEQEDFDGTRNLSSEIKISVPNPNLDLGNAYPSPGRSTNISFKVDENKSVEIKIYNILGQEVRSLVNEEKEAGYYSTLWDGKNENGILVSRGMYLIHMKAGDFNKTVKYILDPDGSEGTNSFNADAFKLEEVVSKTLRKPAAEGVAYDIIFSGNIETDTLKCVIIKGDTTIDKVVTQIINANFNIKDLFSDVNRENATLTSGTATAKTNSSGDAVLKIPINLAKEYQVTIEHDSSYQRGMKFSTSKDDTTINETTVPKSFNMDLFDEVARNPYGLEKATTRWTTQPKFYIVNGPITGYSGFTTPTQEMIDTLVAIINNDLKTFTNGLINNPTVVIGNDPIGYGAGEQIIEATIIPKEGWVTIHYTLANNMDFAGERATYVDDINYNMKKARIRIKGPPVWLTNRKIGMHELTGCMGDLNNTNDIISVFNNPAENADQYSDFDLKMGKLLYSRAPGNMNSDKDK